MRTKALALVFGCAVAGRAGVAAADPGELSPVEIDTIGNVFGYWEYLPAAYDEAESWPLFVFLSGIGENGVGTLDPTACANGPDTAGNYLCRNLRHGPQNLLWRQLHEGETGLWDDVERPFVVISPQNPAPLFEYTAYDVDDLEAFLEFLLDTYAIDPRRMYLVGMSMGGYSTVLSIAAYPHRYAAVSMMPGIAGIDADDVCTLTEQNMWIFHGEVDTNPFPALAMVAFGYQFSQCPEPVPTPRITVYQGAGHNVWTRTIDPPIGLGSAVLDWFFTQGTNVALDPYDIDLYTWLLAHDKPVVDAGPDVEATTDDTLVQLQATTIDDDPVTYTWTQTSGPAVTLANANTDTLDVSGFDVGQYTFEVLVVDADDQHDVDEVVLTVVDVPIGTTGTTGGDASTSSGEPPSTESDETTAQPTSGTPSTEGDATTDDATTNAPATSSDVPTSDGTTPTGGGSMTGVASTASGPGETSGTDGGGGTDTDVDATANEGSGCSCVAGSDRTPPLSILLVLLFGLRRRIRGARSGSGALKRDRAAVSERRRTDASELVAFDTRGD